MRNSKLVLLVAVLLASTVAASPVGARDLDQVSPIRESERSRVAEVTQYGSWTQVDTSNFASTSNRGGVGSVRGVPSHRSEVRSLKLLDEANAAMTAQRGVHPRSQWLDWNNTKIYEQATQNSYQLQLLAGNSRITEAGEIVPDREAIARGNKGWLYWSWSSLPSQIPVDFYQGEDNLEFAQKWESYSILQNGPNCNSNPISCGSQNQGYYTQIRSWWYVIPVKESVEQSSTYDYSIAYVDSSMEGSNGYSRYSWAQQGFKSNNSAAAFLSIAPTSDYSGNCQTTTINVSYSFAGASFGVTRPLTRCENVKLGGSTSQRGWFTETYTPSGGGQSGTRSLSQAITIRYPEGTPLQPVIGHGINFKCNFSIPGC